MTLPRIGDRSQVVSHRFLFSDQSCSFTYINDIDNGLNNLISKFNDDAKIGDSINTDHDRMSLHEDLRKISEWSERWEIPFNVNKCHILQIGTRNQKFEYEMNGTKFESVQCVKDLGITIPSSFRFSRQCKDAAW